MKTICLPSMIPEYRHGSCVVGVRPSLRRIASACFSHGRGDSGLPCIADRTRITWLGGMGGLRLWFTHHLLNAQSGQMKKPCLGGGASANALHTSDPKIFKFSAAETA
jgi:hypothetical protein